MAPRLEQIYLDIHAKAPNARVLVLGYPQLFPRSPEEQNCAKLKKKSLGFSNQEQNYLRQAASELNQTIAARVNHATAKSGAGGLITFVPVDGIFAGHEVCGNGGEWINAASFSLHTLSANTQSFHPNEIGQHEGYAAAVNATAGGGGF